MCIFGCGDGGVLNICDVVVFNGQVDILNLVFGQVGGCGKKLFVFDFFMYRYNENKCILFVE